MKTTWDSVYSIFLFFILKVWEPINTRYYPITGVFLESGCTLNICYLCNNNNKKNVSGPSVNNKYQKEFT